MQYWVLAVTLAIMSVIGLAFLCVVRATAAPPWTRAERTRAALAVGLAGLGVPLMLATLRPWPHALASPQDAVQVIATGAQWNWEVAPDVIPANRPVTFAVVSTDVSHGFAVFSPGGRIIFQTQAMPGYTNRISYTFASPGEYRVACLEYCGLGHHEMAATLTVRAE